MANPINNANIILCVTGSIAAYKAAYLASRLHQEGAAVDVILTESAAKFIAPLTFQSLTGRKAYTDEDLWVGESHVTHIGLGHAANLIVIAPATANTIAKIANGIGDNLLSITVLASQCPLILAPAMDAGMYDNVATQRNIATLVSQGAIIVGPASGHLASGLQGPGRMSDPTEVLGSIRHTLGGKGELAGKNIVVSAGPTQEPIDPVRMITNRSSGRQGYAIAQAALDEGANVTLISGPAHLEIPYGVRYIPVQTTMEMHNASIESCADADALIMSAAPADFKPSMENSRKIKKESGLKSVELEKTVDILSAISVSRRTTGYPKFIVGFAAESENLIANAVSKLHKKQLDLIVANDITDPDAGFIVDTNKVSFIFADGSETTFPKMSKYDVASCILQQVCEWFTN